MELRTRKLLDRSFSGLGISAIMLMAFALLLILTPIIWKGAQAYFFTGTIEHRKVMYDHFGRGNIEKLTKEIKITEKNRAPVYAFIDDFKAEMKEMSSSERREYRTSLREVEKGIKELLGPAPGARKPVLIRQQYGQSRWDRTQVKLH